MKFYNWFAVLLFHLTRLSPGISTWNSFETKKDVDIHLSVVVCGPNDRVEETIANIKSAVVFSQKILKFHIFTEENLKENFTFSLEQWPSHIKSKFQYKVYSIEYPDDGNAKQWKNLFKLCASQRLFLPLILKEVELLLYVDTDVLFLSPVEEIWEFFNRFNSTHISAMAPEHEQSSVSWYHRFARHPYYGKFGINSGVMLMNMSRIRKTLFKTDLQEQTMSWDQMLLPLYQKYKFNITWGDQDLLNIIFHHNPEMMLEFPCNWNYRPDHCMYMQVCEAAERYGVKILHGCRRAFHIAKWPAFKAVYSAIQSFDFDHDKTSILQAINNNLLNTTDTNCKKYFDVVRKGLNNVFAMKQEL